MNKQEDSLKKRYGYKLFTYSISVPVNIIIQAVIPRGLGPETYGQFSFLTNFFQKIISFFDSGTSLAFYTKLSKNLEDRSIIRFYGGLILAAGLLLYLFIEGVIQIESYSLLFPDQTPLYIRLGFVYIFFYWISQVTNKIVDAYGLTVKGELIRVLQQIISLVLILGLYYLEYLNLEIIFIYNYLTFSILIVGWSIYLNTEGVNILKIPRLNLKEIQSKVRDFWVYSAPLITYSFVGMLVGLFDYWFLQNMAGSVEQGYFGLSYKVAAICMVFTKAMTPLIMREFSIAFDAGNNESMRNLFKRYFPLLYSIATFISIFLVINASEVTFIFGGSEFKEASLPMAIMCFYPIHQTYGQLSASIFYATDKTKSYRNIGVSTMLFGGVLLFFLVAPESYNGMDLGAFGLALKLVIVQFVGVNIQLWYSAKLIGVDYWRYLIHQLYVIAFFITIALLSEAVILNITEQLIIGVILNGFLYAVLVALLILKFPVIIGMNASELSKIVKKLTVKLLRKS